MDNGRDAVAEVRRLDPDVLVMDISMPILDRLQAAAQLRRKACRTKVVFLSVHEDQDYVDARLRCRRWRLCNEVPCCF